MPSTDVEYWMKRALTLAQQSYDHDEVPVGCVLVSEGKVLAEAANLRESLGRATAHAEILALEQYSQTTKAWRLPPGTQVFVTLEPCLMCVGALLWARADEVYFGCEDSRRAGMLRIMPLVADGVYDHRFKMVEGGICAEESSKLLSAFFQRLREN